jgi:Ligated ion channel L-glutamate- and glycine-binding site
MKRDGHFFGNDRWEGFLIDLIEAIAQEVKFQYELYEAPDGSYGGLTPSGEWNGMIKEIMIGVSLTEPAKFSTELEFGSRTAFKF